MSKMFLSLSTWIYDHLPFSEVARRVKKCGYEHIELSGAKGWGSGIWQWDEIIKECEKNNIKICSIHCNHHKDLKEEPSFDVFRKYHEEFYSKLKGIGNVVLVEHGPPRRFEAEKDRQLIFLRQLSDYHGFRLSVENVPGTVFQTPGEIKDAFGETTFFTFDAAHAQYIHIEPLAFKKHFSRLVNVHAYDVIEKAKLGDWLPVGMGEMNWESIIASLKEIKYDGPVTVELTEQNLRTVLEVYKKIVDNNISLEVEDSFAIYSREYLEKLI